MKWFAIFTFSIIALLLILPPVCISVETYIWTDEDGNTVVSSEKPPDHITEYQTIGESDAFQETAQEPSDPTQESDTTSQYDDFPALILEKIKRTARKRWPDSESAQEAMVHRQVRACRYVLNARNLNIPVGAFDRIMEDVEHDWPNDYEQQAAYIENQYRSYIEILSYENLDLSNDEINLIKKDAAEKWPFNYVKQEQSLRREAEYRVEKSSY